MEASAERSSRRRWPWVVLGLVVLVVLLIGGYGLKWAWTGFSDNDTLWDWLQLLLLPIVIAGLPLVLAHGDFMERRVRIATAVVLVAFAALVALGYLVPWAWTGFPGNKLWDWFGLILLPIVVGTIRLWPEVRRRVAAGHVVGVTIALSAVIALVLIGYLKPWKWTGFTGNTLWDWIQLLAVPVLVPTILVPAAISFMRHGVEERETAAGVSTTDQEKAKVRADAGAPPERVGVLAIVAAGAGALVVGGVVGALAFGSKKTTTTTTTAVSASTPCADPAATTVVGASDGRVVRQGSTYYGCLPGKQSLRLATGKSGSGAGHFAVTPSRIAFVTETCKAAKCTETVNVARTSDGHIFGPQTLQGARVTDLVLTDDGGIGLMLRNPSQVMLISGGQARTAASGGGLDTGSLAAAGGTVYWRANGRAASAQL